MSNSQLWKRRDISEQYEMDMGTREGEERQEEERVVVYAFRVARCS